MDARAAIESSDELVALPRDGSCFTRRRPVEVSDVSRSGRMGLTVLARYLQDIAADDARGLGIIGAWVARRVTLRLGALPVYGDLLTLRTAITGMGSGWVERRTSVHADDDGTPRPVVEAATVWAHVDPRGRPARVRVESLGRYAEPAAARRVSSRLRHGPPPPDAASRAWPLRGADFDRRGHLNNAAAWCAVDDEVDRSGEGRPPVHAQIEYRAPIVDDDVVELHHRRADDDLWCWLLVTGDVRVSARVGFAPAGSGSVGSGPVGSGPAGSEVAGRAFDDDR